MSDSLGFAIITLTQLGTGAAILYAAYWAFAVRHALVGHGYRNQALWLGVLSVCLALDLAVPSPTTSNAAITILVNIPIIAVALGFFAFIDATVPIARRSDPRLRNILHWEKVRFAAWAFLIWVVITSVYAQVTSDNTGSNIVVPLFALAVIGAPPLFIGARRSMDRSLRESLKWLGAGMVSLLGILLVAIVEAALNVSDSYYASEGYAAVVLLFAYLLYKSARSLAPINRIPTVELLE